jgi:hypothetical protein
MPPDRPPPRFGLRWLTPACLAAEAALEQRGHPLALDAELAGEARWIAHPNAQADDLRPRPCFAAVGDSHPLPSTPDRPGTTTREAGVPPLRPRSLVVVLLSDSAGRSDGRAAPAPALLIPSPLSILGQAHVEEHQQQSAPEPGRDQDNGEHLTGQSAYQSRAEHAGNHEQAG